MRKLRRTPKFQDGVVSRSTPISETYNRIRPLMPLVGITHVLEITELDVLGIPVSLAFGAKDVDNDLFLHAGMSLTQFKDKLERVYETVEQFPLVIESPGGRPFISMGKGYSPLDARVSAMMEAIERFCAYNPSMQPNIKSTKQMQKEFGDAVIHPTSLILLSPEDFTEEVEIEWVPGMDLVSNQTVWVPADSATLHYEPLGAPRICTDTATGLGAGNNYEEAISHGLAEVIEHDAWTLALVAHSLNETERFFTDSLFSKPSSSSISDESESRDQQDAFVRLNLDSLEGVTPLDELVRKLRDSATSIDVHEITSDIPIPSFSVAISGHEGLSDGGGLGTHPDARIALLRALTEAVQQRLIRGIREMTRKGIMYKTWKLSFPIGDPSGSNGSKYRDFQDVVSHTYSDVLEDIQYMLASVEERGLSRVVVVDLKKNEIEVPVVKVIVPGMADYWTSDQTANWRALGPRVMRNFQ